MKNLYEEPIAEIVKFDSEDIVTASAPYAIDEDPVNGNAYESVKNFKD